MFYVQLRRCAADPTKAIQDLNNTLRTFFARAVSSSAMVSLDGSWLPWPPGADPPPPPHSSEAVWGGKSDLCTWQFVPVGLRVQVVFAALLWQPAEHRGTWNQKPETPSSPSTTFSPHFHSPLLGHVYHQPFILHDLWLVPSVYTLHHVSAGDVILLALSKRCKQC